MSNETAKVEAPKKTRVRADSTYEVISLPANRERLGPQLRTLVEVIETSIVEVEGKKTVSRSAILAKWAEKVDSGSGGKVFGGYIHQLLGFAFLDRVVSGAPPKRVISQIERKNKLLAMLAKLPEADRKELLAAMGQ